MNAPESNPRPQTGQPNPIHSIIIAAHDEADPRMSFAHAMKLAVVTMGELEIVDIRNNEDSDKAVGVRAILEKWQLIPPGSTRHDVEKIGLKIKKIIKYGSGAKEINKRLLKRDHDLLVLGVRSKKGLRHVFGRDLVAYLSGASRQTTLYIPEKSKPFVNSYNGNVNLERILVPVDRNPSPDFSLLMLKRLLLQLNRQNAEIILLHYGDSFPELDSSHTESFSVRKILRPLTRKPIAQAILTEAINEKTDLIVMTTNGRNTMSQRFAGSITEQVLGKSLCPVLAVAVR